ncbi:hypothetical protein KEM54_003131, partial [Ascosphaera aggregata]
DDYASRTILVLDDCSGVTIEVVCSKKKVKVFIDDDDNDKQRSNYSTAFAGDESSTSAISATTMQHITASTSSPIDISPLQPCKRVKVKGTLSFLSLPRYTSTKSPVTINGGGAGAGADVADGAGGLTISSTSKLPALENTRIRLNLERFQILPDLPAEIHFWSESMRIYSEFLCVPWRLTEEQIQNMKRRAERNVLGKEKQVFRDKAVGRIGKMRYLADAQSQIVKQEEEARKGTQKDIRDRDRIERLWQKEESFRHIEVQKVKQVNRKFEEQLKMSRASRRAERSQPI